jgi:alkanesulfonate monooxygenase
MARLDRTFGIAVPNFTAYPQMPDIKALVEYGVRMEQLGFDSLWVWDHILLGVEPNFPIIESLTLLTAIAARTSKIKLGTGILVLPMRNPVILAKQLACMDLLSDGRLLMGMASGWYRREFNAIGVPFEQRGKIMDENLDILKRFWTEHTVSGKFTRYDIPAGVMYPKPVQKPYPPILIGGYVDRVLKRAAVDGDGWLTYFYRPDSFAKSWDKIRGFAKEAGKDPDKLLNASQLPIYVGKSRQAVDGVAHQGMGFRVLERIDEGQRRHGNRRRMRRAAQGARGRRNAKDHLRSLQVRGGADRAYCARDHSPAEGEMTHLARHGDHGEACRRANLARKHAPGRAAWAQFRLAHAFAPHVIIRPEARTAGCEGPCKESTHFQ